MFSTITTVTLLATFAFVGIHSVITLASAAKCGRKFGAIDIIKLPVFLLTLLFVEQKLTFIGVIKKLLFLLTLLCFVVLLLTGFIPKLICGHTITGYPLMIHATFAPIFAICIAVLAVLTAAQHSFDRSNWRIVLNICKPDDPAIEACEKSGCFVKKLCFWVVIALSLPLIISVLLGMLPFFDVHAQELFINIHRYSAVFLTASAIIYIYLTVIEKARS